MGIVGIMVASVPDFVERPVDFDIHYIRSNLEQPDNKIRFTSSFKFLTPLLAELIEESPL